MALKIINKDCCDIYQKFEKSSFLLKNYYYWEVLIRNKQVTLGSCVIILKRHVEAFSQVEPDELVELSDVIIDLEKALQKSFSYNKINYLMLMMVDNHVHFHVLPRYEKQQVFTNITFLDKCWPKVSDMAVLDLNKDILLKIKDKVKSNYYNDKTL